MDADGYPDYDDTGFSPLVMSSTMHANIKAIPAIPLYMMSRCVLARVGGGSLLSQRVSRLHPL